MQGSKYQRNCSICGEVFDIKIMRNGRPSTRKTCSKECSLVNRSIPIPWTDPEIEFLTKHVESLPFHRLVRAYKTWAAQHDYPSRSNTSIDHKIRRLGFGTKPQIEYFTFQRLSEILGISNYTVAGWKRLVKHPLQAYQHDGKRYAFNYVSRLDFNRFAQHHPECLGGVNEIGLQILLEDSKKAKEILRQYPKRRNPLIKSKRVRCIETGKIYQSLGAAARDVHVVRQGVSKSVHYGHAANGFHFELIDHE